MHTAVAALIPFWWLGLSPPRVLISCAIFYYIQKWMPHRTARWIRRISKRFQRNSDLVRDGAVDYARSKGCNAVTCGHTHFHLVEAVGDVTYLNSGTWIEAPPCPFIAVRGSVVDLRFWPVGEAEPVVAAPRDKVEVSPT